MNLVWEDENMARHWIDRYAAGLDEAAQLDRILECVGAIYEANELDPELRPSPPAEPVAWLIAWKGKDQAFRAVQFHNAIADYRDFDPKATSTPLYAAPPPDRLAEPDRFEALLHDLEALPKSERPSKGSNGGRRVPFIRVSDLRAILAKYNQPRDSAEGEK